MKQNNSSKQIKTGKNDPTKQNERDNDATRIRPEKQKREQPETPPDNPGNAPGNKGVADPELKESVEKEPRSKQSPLEEPGPQQQAENDRGYNSAFPANKQNDTTEKDDSGNPVMKRFGRGL